jgi:hypothetical protein
MGEKLNHGKLIRWLRGIAERQVTAAESRATFTSDMYFDAAEAIETLQAEKAAIIEAAERVLAWQDPIEVCAPELGGATSAFESLRSAIKRAKGGE